MPKRCGAGIRVLVAFRKTARISRSCAGVNQTRMEIEFLRRFCHLDRSGIDTPWSEGNWSYATDGNVILRVTRIESVPERINAPAGIEKSIFGSILPAIACAPPQPIGEDEETCPICKGTGNCQCTHCSRNHDCGKCGGDKTVAALTQVGAQHFRTRTLRLIAQLPSAEWFPTENRRTYFRFQGGDGIILPTEPAAH